MHGRRGLLSTLLWKCTITASGVFAMACSESTSDPSEPPPQAKAVALVQLTPATVPLGRAGQSIQFTATIKASDGSIIVGRPMTWTTDPPSAISVSPTGVASLLEPVRYGSSISLTVETKSAVSVVQQIAGWKQSSDNDPVTQTTTWFATLDDVERSFGSTATLYLRCRPSAMDVYIAVDGVTASGGVTYRFAGQSAVGAQWNESTSFTALFLPGSTFAKRQFISNLSAADTLHFRWTRYLGTARDHKFLGTDFLGAVAATLAHCPQ